MNFIFYCVVQYFEKDSKNELRKFRKCFLHVTLFLTWLINKYPLFFLDAFENYKPVKNTDKWSGGGKLENYQRGAKRAKKCTGGVGIASFAP